MKHRTYGDYVKEVEDIMGSKIAKQDDNKRSFYDKKLMKQFRKIKSQRNNINQYNGNK